MSDEVKLLPCEINAEMLNRSATYRALLKRCAKHLEATDCGTGQLHWDIRQALLSSVTDEAGAAIEATRPTEQGLGVPASPSGHSRAEPEEVSVVPTSVPNAAYALPLAGYPVPETVATREHSLHCFACGGALSHSCICERVVLPRDGLRSLIFWVQTDTASAIEARRAADSEAGAVHESAVPQGDAHE